MRKSLRLLAVATALSLSMTVPAFAETVANPGEWIEVTTSDWSGYPTQIKYTMHPITEAEVRDATMIGVYGEKEYGSGIQEYWEFESINQSTYNEILQLNPGYTAYTVAWTRTGQGVSGNTANGCFDAVAVAGTDVKDYRRVQNVQEAMTLTDGFHSKSSLKGTFTLTWNGVDYPCKHFVLGADGWKSTELQVVTLPAGYNGDVSINTYPILWKGATYDKAQVQSIEGYADAIALNTSIDFANRIECYVTGSKVQPRPEGFVYENSLGRRERVIQEILEARAKPY